ncbi:MAG: hypothetical protein ACE5F2_02655 [Candidatus Paceibacteria bacterium]
MDTVTEKETLWGFQEKDIVTIDSCEILGGKRWEILVFNIVENHFGEQGCFPKPNDGMYVKRKDTNNFDDYISIFLHSHCPIDGLVLLERSDYKFKVGDRVYVNKIGQGEIIVINPEQRLDFVYLVLLDENTIKEGSNGHDIANYYEEPWFPDKYVDIMKKGIVFWCPDTKLKLLN